jgi:hypothetical protein
VGVVEFQWLWEVVDDGVSHHWRHYIYMGVQ